VISTRVFGTKVAIKPVVLMDLVVLWGATSWLDHSWHPLREIPQSILVGLAAMILLVSADFGHALAHILSARLAQAPMDLLLISEGMPRTLYTNNAVLPRVHIVRALGGPIFNTFGLALSLAFVLLVRPHPIALELAGWSAVGHGLLLVASLLPLPPVDGGTLLKWAMVQRGLTEEAADARIRQIDGAIAVGAGAAALWMFASKFWGAGLALTGIAALVWAIAAGKVR
jgi:hypothetical protein